MDNKDSFYSFNYKGFTIHTCENNTTHESEVYVQWGGNRYHKRTIAGAKRYITKLINAGCVDN